MRSADRGSAWALFLCWQRRRNSHRRDESRRSGRGQCRSALPGHGDQRQRCQQHVGPFVGQSAWFLPEIASRGRRRASVPGTAPRLPEMYPTSPKTPESPCLSTTSSKILSAVYPALTRSRCWETPPPGHHQGHGQGHHVRRGVPPHRRSRGVTHYTDLLRERVRMRVSR